MPELPDVEGHRRLVADRAAGTRVEAVEVPDPDLLEGTTPQGLGRSLHGRRIAAPLRHGKWLCITTDGGDGPRLVIHFGMTGELVWDADDTDRDVVRLRLDAGTLTYRSIRRLGRVHHLGPGQDLTEVTGELGPDALDVDRERLAELLADRRGGIKSALMDQTVIAGLGNELVDDILWRAGLHPRRAAGSLGAAELERLHRKMRSVLTTSVRAGHVPSGPTWLNGQRGADDPRCPNDDTPLERAQVAGRTTYWCPEEQPAG